MRGKKRRILKMSLFLLHSNLKGIKLIYLRDRKCEIFFPSLFYKICEVSNKLNFFFSLSSPFVEHTVREKERPMLYLICPNEKIKMVRGDKIRFDRRIPPIRLTYFQSVLIFSKVKVTRT